MTTKAAKSEPKLGFYVMVNGKMQRNRIDDLEDAVQYIRSIKGGGKSVRLFRELPSPSLVR